jgi:hypothetical protein
MPDDRQRGRRLMPRPADFLPAAAEALRIIAERGDDTDAWLLARRAAEYELRAGPDGGLTGQVYRDAAAALREFGHEAEAAGLEAIAATSTHLDQASLSWRARYEGRPMTTAEQADFELLENGSIQPYQPNKTAGTDGAFYSAANRVEPSAAASPVVIVTTPAATLEIITGFRDENQQTAWLADRTAPGSTGPDQPAPLASCLSGPACRTAREEQVLARLVQHGDPGGELTTRLLTWTFCTYARSETYLAWCTSAGDTARPETAQIRTELARRLLRAPGWAADYVGWPFGQRALAYFDRLAATPVTRDQATAAARELVREDTEAMKLASHRTPLPWTRQAPRRPERSAAPPAAPRPPQLQRPSGHAPGITPRM